MGDWCIAPDPDPAAHPALLAFPSLNQVQRLPLSSSSSRGGGGLQMTPSQRKRKRRGAGKPRGPAWRGHLLQGGILCAAAGPAPKSRSRTAIC